MSKAAFRQADMERIFRAAAVAGLSVQVDMRTLVATVIPTIHRDAGIDERRDKTRILPPGNLAPDGKDNF